MNTPTVKIRVPYWVNTDNEGICMLFSFMRRIAIEYNLSDVPLDMYGHDIRRIIGREEKGLHDYLDQFIDTRWCKIAKLNREHFVFTMKHIRTRTNTVEIKRPLNVVKWGYLMGCTNYNLIEEPVDKELTGRPAYTPMYKLERDLFNFERDGS